jgi:hypothetical protein
LNQLKQDVRGLLNIFRKAKPLFLTTFPFAPTTRSLSTPTSKATFATLEALMPLEIDKNNCSANLYGALETEFKKYV